MISEVEVYMSLVLKYHGPLSPTQRDDKHLPEKQQIRRFFHNQLKRAMKKPFAKYTNPDNLTEVRGFRFRSLICADKFYPQRGCELNIQILSDDPFRSVYNRGDLDNRMKTLFDSLGAPNKFQLPAGEVPLEGEDPFWVLLSDDCSITDIHIVQHKLNEEHEPNYVELILEVKIRDGYLP